MSDTPTLEKNRREKFYQLVNGCAYEIDEVDVGAALDGKIVADVADKED